MLQPVASSGVGTETGLMSAAVRSIPSRTNPVGEHVAARAGEAGTSKVANAARQRSGFLTMPSMAVRSFPDELPASGINGLRNRRELQESQSVGDGVHEQCRFSKRGGTCRRGRGREERGLLSAPIRDFLMTLVRVDRR